MRRRSSVDPAACALEPPSERWADIRLWRRARRAELLSRREVIPPGKRQAAGRTIRNLIRDRFPDLRTACIGLYWPFRGEIDVRDLVGDFLAAGAEAALPVVVEKQRPLEFWKWRPGMKLGRGIWDIPIPAERIVVQPTALLVPLLGFDGAGYRLGYGGGYYDRTLAAMDPAPLTIGVGYAAARLKTIYPQRRDIPLDAIASEAGCTQFARRGEVERRAARDPLDAGGDSGSAYASPACFMHEVDPAYGGYLSGSEVIVLLNRLLEGERAGARGVLEMAKTAAEAAHISTLREIAADEARFCAMLSRHIARLGGTPTSQTGAFYEKLLSVEALGQRLELLNRGQAWVVRKIGEALPKIGDDALHRDLKTMLEVHQRNVQRCTDVRPSASTS